MTGPARAAPRQFAGRYAVDREIGRGASATVYLARDLELGSEVAIKVLRPDLCQSVASDYFLREIRLTSGFEHPRIVPVLDAGNDNGQLYYTLPYMEGGTLRQRLDREKQLPIPDAVGIAADVAEALEHAHTRGTIHRDVKPENILFTQGQPCLADFGVARVLEKVLGELSTSSGIVRGTPAYMSPEQASGGRDYDGRSDVFSLGCVLYEMLAGMPAFVGPTPEVVLAQRFAHSPRDLRVYRPSVPDAVATALKKALELSPADRFRNAGEFAHALRAALAPSAGASSTSIAGPGMDRRATSKTRLIGLVVGAALLGIFAFAMRIATRPAATPATATADTTRLVVFPLGHDSLTNVRHIDDDLLYEALSQWRGIVLVDQMQTADALSRQRPIRSGADASVLSTSLGAGRYIRGRITPVGDSWRAYAALYNTGDSHALYQATEHVPAGLDGAIAAYRRLADSLLLRGATGDARANRAQGTRSLPAVQAMGRAQVNLDEWDLAAAEASFEAAVGFDPNYARASLWLAQVRAWRQVAPASWASVAERADAAGIALPDREHKLAHALVLLATGQYAAACDMYDQLRRRDDHDFAAWFGLGQCRRMDKVVVADPASPSRWRFRSSYHQAAIAFAKAFEILPSVHREYERGAFEPLMRLLLVSTDLVTGYAVGRDTSAFLARPSLAGDTLVMVPYPWDLVVSDSPDAIPPQYERALERQRTEFRRVAAGWSAAFPQSAGAKHAVAIALELLGDVGAIDTLRLARRLTTDAARRAQLAAREALLLVKFGLPDNLTYLRSAQSLADSLLAPNAVRAFDAEALAPVAAIAGRCSAAERLARRIPIPRAALDIPPPLYTDAQVVLARAAIGCSDASSSPTFRELATAVRRAAATDSSTARMLDEVLLFRTSLLASVLDSAVINHLATTSSNDLVRAAKAFTRHDQPAMRAALSSVGAQPRPGITTPDIAYPSARLWASAGDTANAIAWLDRTLGGVRGFDPNVLADAPTLGALIRSMVLRAELAAAKRDVATARRWATAAGVLWSGADPELDPVVRRMRDLASLR